MTAATTTRTTAERSSTAIGRVARSATEIAQPPLVLSLLLILASLLSDQWMVSIWSGIIAALFICLVPFAVVLMLAKRGQLTDHHVGDKKQRRPVMLWTLGSSLLGCAILSVIGGTPARLGANWRDSLRDCGPHSGQPDLEDIGPCNDVGRRDRVSGTDVRLARSSVRRGGPACLLVQGLSPGPLSSSGHCRVHNRRSRFRSLIYSHCRLIFTWHPTKPPRPDKWPQR